MPFKVVIYERNLKNQDQRLTLKSPLNDRPCLPKLPNWVLRSESK